MKGIYLTILLILLLCGELSAQCKIAIVDVQEVLESTTACQEVYDSVARFNISLYNQYRVLLPQYDSLFNKLSSIGCSRIYLAELDLDLGRLKMISNKLEYLELNSDSLCANLQATLMQDLQKQVREEVSRYLESNGYLSYADASHALYIEQEEVCDITALVKKNIRLK